MFGSRRTHFDVERFIRERHIVILNLAAYCKLNPHDGRTIGALAVNEIFEKAFHMATTYGRQSVDPTYVLMDEFQHFVGPDIEDALPTVRQMGLRLLLAHQAFYQLERGEVDLNGMIWQARSRLMFANDGEDADRLAHELAMRTFDPKEIKDLRTSRKQLIVDYRKEWLDSLSSTTTRANASSEQEMMGYTRNRGEARHPRADLATRSESEGRSTSATRGRTQADSFGNSHGQSQTMVPIHETFDEISNITYKSFQEHRVEWGQRVRELRTGEAFGVFVNDPKLYSILVDYDPVEPSAAIEEAKQELIEKNFEAEFFVSATEADREAQEVREMLLRRPSIVIDAQPKDTIALPCTGQSQVQSSARIPSAPNRPAKKTPFRD